VSNFSEEILYGFIGLSLKTEWNEKINQSVFLPISEAERDTLMDTVRKEGKSVKQLYYVAAEFFASKPIYFKGDGDETGRYFFWQRYDLRWDF
jgi:hypothetical protein